MWSSKGTVDLIHCGILKYNLLMERLSHTNVTFFETLDDENVRQFSAHTRRITLLLFKAEQKNSEICFLTVCRGNNRYKLKVVEQNALKS